MKKTIFLTAIATVFLCILLASPAQSVSPYRYVKVEGRQLLVDFDKNGIYEPYFIKGLGYSPTPIGRHVSDWGWPEDPNDPRPDNIYDDPAILNRDFDLLQQMGVNTIRIWKGDDTEDSGGRFPIKLTQTTLDLAQAHGIKVIAGFWIDTPGPYCDGTNLIYNPPDFLDPSNPNFGPARVAIINRFKDYVSDFKDHPAILFWAIGNENDDRIPDIDALAYWFSLTNQMAYEAHRSEDPTFPSGGTNYHPVAVANGDIDKIDVHGSHDDQMASVNIWGANVYRGQSFGSLFTDYAPKSAKPIWISEYGIDAWHTTAYIEGPAWFQDGYEGYEDQTAQAAWTGKLLDEIVLNDNVCIGGTAMEYSDEWWKPYEWIEGGIYNGTHDHFGYGPQDTSCPRDGTPDWIPSSPDQFFNEEWFGIMSIDQSVQPYYPDIVTARQVYYSLQARFECGEDGAGKYYAGSDNGKSCDGTDACCNNPNMKAKKGYCVYSCQSVPTKVKPIMLDTETYFPRR